ncbi:RNA-directed DNA polymerase, eukaryota, reverse transcriptase zinc-binding domain protein [Tanacetum coccineum]
MGKFIESKYEPSVNISRVCESGDESRLKIDNTEGMKCIDIESSVEMSEANQNEYEQSNVEAAQSTEVLNVSPISMQVNVSTVKTCMGNYDEKKSNSSYAGKVGSNEMNVDNKLNHIPTVINDDGLEYVIFDEELVKEGSKKWELSACGYFVGYRMPIQELRYHLYRMWSKFGLKHILNNGNGVFVFKFDNNQGLQIVIENGPWIVNNKPMVVQK